MSTDLAVLEFLIREHPLALCATTNVGNTPLKLATIHNRPAAITSLLADTTAALASLDYPALTARVHGNQKTLQFLALSPERLLTRTSILLCLRRLPHSLDPAPLTSLIR